MRTPRSTPSQFNANVLGLTGMLHFAIAGHGHWWRTQALFSVVWFALWVSSARPADVAVQPYAYSQTGAGDSFNPIFSPDGNHLVFESWANNLVTNDNRFPFLDVFIRSLESKITRLVSVNLDGTGGGNGNSGFASVSSNGHLVAFASEASDLVLDDTNGHWDVFVRDAILGQTHLISVPASGQGGAQGEPLSENMRLSDCPILSANGHWVVFESLATNLTVLMDTNRQSDIFARDLVNAQTMLVSVNADGTGAGDGRSTDASFSVVKSRVAFASKARDIGPINAGFSQEVYVRDLESGRFWWASRDMPQFVSGPAAAVEPVLCADGSKLAFKALREGSDSGLLLILDLEDEQLVKIPATEVKEGSIVDWSADGQWIAYETSPYVYVSNSVGRRVRISPYDDNCPGSVSRPVPTCWPSLAWNRSGVTFVVRRCEGPASVCFQELYESPLGEIWAPPAVVEYVCEDSMCDLIRPELAPDGRWMAIGSAQSWTITNDLNRARDIFIAYTESNRVEVASPEEPLRAAMTGTGMTSVTPEAASVNGEAIAAASLDNVYSPRDTNGVQELFLSYWRAGTSQSIINHRAGSIGQWDQWLGSAALSPNGRYLAYTASQLGLGFFGPLHENIFWLDLATGLSRQVNSCFSQWEVGKTQPKIHPNGTMVVFQGLAPNPCSALSRLLFYQASHVYLWSNRAQPGQEIQLVSLARDRSTSGNTDSLNPLFSPDGQWIVFQSLSTNLALQPVSGLRHQLLARRWAAGSTHLVSYNASFQGLDHTALGPSFSSDSRYLAFYTEPELKSYRHALPDTRGWKEFYPDGTNNWLLIPSNPDPVLQPNLELCSACSHPTLNHDGSLAAFLSHGESAQPDQIYVKDLETGGATLISTDATGAGAANGNCADAQISFDGRFVLFTSLADNLVEGDANRARDVFVRDRWLGLTVLLSRSVDGNRSANLASFHPFFSADGRTVVFQSFADDLVHGDYNLVRDVFVVRLGGEDSDGDGLEDDWETAYFGDLSRDGTLDYDADGHADGDDSKRAPTPSTMHPSYPC